MLEQVAQRVQPWAGPHAPGDARAVAGVLEQVAQRVQRRAVHRRRRVHVHHLAAHVRGRHPRHRGGEQQLHVAAQRRRLQRQRLRQVQQDGARLRTVEAHR